MKPPRIFIFGAGGAGRAAYKQLNQTHTILGFLDNNPRLHRTKLFGVPIFPPEQFPRGEEDFIVIASMYVEEILAQLLELGYPLDKIEFFHYSPDIHSSPPTRQTVFFNSSTAWIIFLSTLVALILGFLLGRLSLADWFFSPFAAVRQINGLHLLIL